MARRPKLNDTIERIILETLRVGATFEAAAGRAGVAVDTIHEWRRRGAGKHPTRPRTARLARFAIAVDQALADAEVRHVATIGKAAANHWQAAAWLLERRHPDRYGRADRSTVAVSVQQPTADAAALLAEASDEELEAIENILRGARERVRGGETDE